jgi:23S rRNA pseudouridine1911/1915/1917 synthase
MKHSLPVDEAANGTRVDLFLGERLKLSRNRLKALFEAGEVRVDGRRVKKGQTVSTGQQVELTVDETPMEAQPDASLALSVLWEDEHLIFIDKPAQMPSHPLKAGETGTVANALVARSPQLVEVGLDPREAGLCHRLDVETSGVLLAAKSRAVWETLRAAFGQETESIDKRYVALVSGPLADEGVIEVPLLHAGDHVRPVLTGTDARPARSAFTVLERQGTFSLVEVRIFTGVLHQVRAHLAAVGAPIVGDAHYGGLADPLLGRFFLHAASLTIEHPVAGRRFTVHSPLPAPLREALGRHGLSGARVP